VDGHVAEYIERPLHSTLVILLVIASEAKEELSDAAVTLDDVRKIVPEIRQSLGILKTLCNNFPDYCN
jgi:hypothetical protein